jgi:hypothetical protein
VIVGLTGHFHAGKDEVARRLVARHGFVRYGWSDALKREVRDRLGRTLVAYVVERADLMRVDPPADMEAEIRRLLYVQRTPVTRALLQEYGTEVRRADDPDYWVHKLWRVVAHEAKGRHVVIADTRFPNEADSVRRQGALVRVVRPGFHGNDHESERYVDTMAVDHEFRNDGTLEDLWAQVDAWAAAHVR